MLNSDETISVTDTAKNGAEGIKLMRSLRPDIVISDIKMSILSCILKRSVV